MPRNTSTPSPCLIAAVLHLQHATLGPLAALAEFDRAVDGLERGLADVVGQHVVLEAVGALDCVAEHLDVGIAPAAQVVAQRIDALGLGALLVLLEERFGALEHHLLGRHPGLVVDEAVEQRAQLVLEHGRLQPDHGAADQLRLEAELVDRFDDAHRVQRIGAHRHDVGIGGLDGAHHRREVGRGRWIGLVVDDLEPGLGRVLARTLAGVLGELLIRGDQRHRLGLGGLRRGDLEEAFSE